MKIYVPPQASCWPPSTIAKMKIEWPCFWLVGLVWVGGEFGESEEAEESQIEHGI